MTVRAIVLNDCSSRSHLGTRLVIQGLRTAAAHAGIVIQRTYPLGYDQWDSSFDQELTGAEVVLLNGEGTCHHDARNALRMFAGAARAKAQGKPVVLLNSVWEANTRLNDHLRHVDLVFVRESRSAAAMRATGRVPVVVPDLSLSADLPTAGGLGDGPPVIVDSVVDSIAFELARYAARAGYPFFPMQRWFGRLAIRRPMATVSAAIANRSTMRAFDQSALALLRRSALLVSGRYHGICLAVLLGTPFLALPSNTAKSGGLCDDAGVPEAMLGGTEELGQRVSALLADRAAREAMAASLSRYRAAAVAAHRRMFADIASLA